MVDIVMLYTELRMVKSILLIGVIIILQVLVWKYPMKVGVIITMVWLNGSDLTVQIATNPLNNSKVYKLWGNIMNICPECGENTLQMDGGCMICLSCGYSKCDMWGVKQWKISFQIIQS